MRIKISAILILVALILLSCKEKHESKNSILVPAFAIKVDLDQRAERVLRERGETIKLSVWIAGDPRKDVDIKEINKALGLVLSYFEKEVDKEGVVRFEDLKIPVNLYQALADKDYRIVVSVRSGRKSSGSNLLNCEPFGRGISKVAGKQHVINCKLIRDSY